MQDHLVEFLKGIFTPLVVTTLQYIFAIGVVLLALKFISWVIGDK